MFGDLGGVVRVNQVLTDAATASNAAKSTFRPGLTLEVGVDVRLSGMRMFTLALCCALVVVGGCGEKTEEQLLASARQSLAKGNQVAASVELRAALQQNPKLSAARLEMGKLMLAQGDALSAEIELRKLLQTEMPRSSVVPSLARAQLALRRLPKLIEEFGAATLDDPAAMADLQASLAAAFGYSGNFAEARLRAEAALKLQPAMSTARLIKVRLLVGEGDIAGGEALLAETLKLDPKNADVWQLKGDLALRAKTGVTDATASYRKVLELQPSRLDAHAALIGIQFFNKDLPAARKQFEALRKVLPNHPQTIFFEAQLAYLSSDFKRARDLASQLLKVLPDSIGILQFAGATELNLGALLPAEAHLGKALKLVPDLVSARRLLTKVYVRGGQPAKALEVVQPNLRLKDPDADSLALAAEAYLQSGNHRQAEQYFQQALKLKPGDTLIRTAVALSKLASGDEGAGFADLQSISSQDQDIVADKALISARFTRSDYDGALTAIAVLEKKQPKMPLAPSLQGQALLLKKDMEGARKAFELALARDPAYFSAAAKLAAIDLAEQKPEAAIARYQSILKSDPGSVQANIAIAELRAMQGASKEEVVRHYEDAIRAKPGDETPRKLLVHYLLARRDFKGALTTAQAGAAALPGSIELLDSLAQAQALSGDFNQAISTFNKVLILRPTSVPVLMRLAGAYKLSGNKKSAEQVLRRALAASPKDINIQRELIGSALTERDPQRALMIARAVQAQYPREAIGFTLEGDVQVVIGNTAAALAAFETAKAKDNPGKLPSRLHYVLLTAKRSQEADKFSEDWLQKHPKDIGFIQYLGDISLARNDWPLAEQKYRRLIALGKPSAGSLNNLAWLLLQRQSPEALSLAERAASMSPESAETLDTLAQALSQNGKYERAVEVQKRAIAISPSSDLLKLNLAKIYAKSGEKLAARTLLLQLQTSPGDFAKEHQVAKLIAEL